MSQATIVFLSSTWKDLEEHRAAVLFTLARLKKQVESMEYFGAMSEETIEISLKTLQKTEVCICILGTRYGTKDKDGKSISELEYDQAFLHKQKILVYLIDEENHPVFPKYVDIGDDAIRLAAFKKKVIGRHTCKTFTSPDNLAGQIGIDLIKLFEDMGKDIRAAIEKESVTQLLVDTGFSFTESEVALNIAPILGKSGAGLFHFNDKGIESLLAAGFIAHNLRENNYSILEHFVSFRPEVWSLLEHLLRRSELDEKHLREQIRKCQNSFQLRLLISIAGKIEADSCADAICAKLFEHKNHHRHIQEYRLLITSFYDIVSAALGSLSPLTSLVIQRYINLAKTKRKWQIKTLLERSLKLQSRNAT